MSLRLLYSSYIILCYIFITIKINAQDIDLLSPKYNSFFTEIDNELWIASSGTGWNRYRGFDTEEYYLEDSLSGLKGTYIQSQVFKDFRGHLWTTTYEYLCEYNPTTDRFNSNQLVLDSTCIESGYHIFGMNDEASQLYIRLHQTLVRFDIATQKISKIIGDTQGAFFTLWGDTIAGAPWLNANGFELWMKDSDSWIKQDIEFKDCPDIGNKRVTKIIHHKGIWLLTDDGLIDFNIYNPCKSRLYSYSKNHTCAFIDGEVVDSLLLLTSDNFGVLIFNLNTKTFVKRSYFENRRIDEIFLDSADYVWLSDYSKGVSKFPKEKFIHVFESNHNVNHWDGYSFQKNVSCLFNREKGVLIKKGKITRFLETINHLPFQLIVDTKLLDEDRILICGQSKCLVYHIESGKFTYLSNDSNQQYTGFYIDDGNFYLFNLNNKFKYDKETLKFVKKEKIQGEILVDEPNLRAQRLGSSKILISTTDGVNDTIIDVKSYVNELEAFEGEKFITTNNGLYLMNSDYQLYSISDKLPSIKNEEFHSLQVYNNWLYFSTNHQIGRYHILDENIELSKKYFTHRPHFDIIDDAIRISSDYFIERPLENIFIKDSISSVHLETLKINNKTWDNPSNMHLSHLQNNISWKYVMLCHFDANPCKILYRLLPLDTTWQLTNNGEEIQYNFLLPHQYTLEVKGITSNGSMTEITRFNFKIAPIWYKSLSFFIILFLTGLTSIYYFFKRKTHRLQEAYRINKEINALERSALQAQMNPHFIFNCLNSIQRYIMLNDKENAMEYLATFATLIRQYLTASSTNLIAIDEEVSLLKNYLELESLRFHDAFSYTFHIDDAIDPICMKIPPMLIQPFVENAILHGMKGKSNNEGMIEISFNLMLQTLLIQISDNGTGFDQNAKSETKHNSMGMSITQKRLQFIKDKAGKDYDLDIQSSSAGTTVRIEIPQELYQG